MAYQAPIDSGCRFTVKGRNFIIMVANTEGGVINGLFVESSDGWDLLAALGGGFMDGSQWVNDVKAKGGIGYDVVGNRLDIQRAVDRYCDPTPTLPVITNASEVNPDNYNAAYKEYVHAVLDPTNTNAPTIKVDG